MQTRDDAITEAYRLLLLVGFHLVGTPAEKQAIDLLRAALDEVEAPEEQLERLGIA